MNFQPPEEDDPRDDDQRQQAATKPGEADLTDEQIGNVAENFGINRHAFAGALKVLAALGTAPATPVPASEPVAQKAGDNRVQTCPTCAAGYGNVIVRNPAAWKALAHKTPLYTTPTSPAPAPATQADAAEVGEEAAAGWTWQDMRSAPKNGAECLLDTIECGLVVAYWDSFDVPPMWCNGFDNSKLTPVRWSVLPPRIQGWPAAPADSSMGGGER